MSYPSYPQADDNGYPIDYDIVCRKCKAKNTLQSVAVVVEGFDVGSAGIEPNAAPSYRSRKVECRSCGKWSRDEDKMAKVVRRDV